MFRVPQVLSKTTAQIQEQAAREASRHNGLTATQCGPFVVHSLPARPQVEEPHEALAKAHNKQARARSRNALLASSSDSEKSLPLAKAVRNAQSLEVESLSDPDTEDQLEDADDLESFMSEDAQRSEDGSDSGNSIKEWLAPESSAAERKRIAQELREQEERDDSEERQAPPPRYRAAPPPEKLPGLRRGVRHLSGQVVQEERNESMFKITPELVEDWDTKGIPTNVVPLGFKFRDDDLDQGSPTIAPNDLGELAVDGGKKGTRRVNITLNNPSQDEALNILRYMAESDKYGCFTFEVGEDCGTSHIHAYLVLQDAATVSAIKKRGIGFKRAHVEYVGGTEKQNADYISKGGYWGEANPTAYSPGQGKRMELATAAALVRDEGLDGLKKVVASQPELAVKYPGGFQFLVRFASEGRQLEQAPEVVWFYGEAGTGKNWTSELLAKSLAEKYGPLNHINLGKWMGEGYEGGKLILMDEIRAENTNMSLILRLWDKRPVQLEIKGGMTQCLGEYFITTCRLPPWEFWEGATLARNDDPSQFMRRITRVVRCERHMDQENNVTFTCTEIVKGPPGNFWPGVGYDTKPFVF